MGEDGYVVGCGEDMGCYVIREGGGSSFDVGIFEMFLRYYWNIISFVRVEGLFVCIIMYFSV